MRLPRRRPALLFAPLLFALAASAEVPLGAFPSEGWEKTDESDGVVVFKREVPGSPFHGIRGSGLVDASPFTVALVLLDDARSPEWVDSLDQALVVNVLSPEDYIEYNHVNMPWPVRDREFLNRVTMAHDQQSRVSVIKSEPWEMPAFPGRPRSIRGTLRALYTLEPAGDGKQTRLTVEIHSDPGGWLPGWLVNFFQKDWAHETIAGIRKQAKKPDLVAPPEFAAWLEKLK
jgi:START domain